MNGEEKGGDYADLVPAPPAEPSPPAEQEPEPPAPPPPPGGRLPGQVVFGAVLVVIGAVWLLSVLDVADIAWRGILAALLIAVGVGLVVIARSGPHGGLIALGVILSLFLALASTVEGLFDVPFEGGIGDRSYRPVAAVDVEDAYRLSIGQLLVDLTAIDFPPGTTEIEASVVIGQVIVEVPPGIAVEIIGKAGAGNVKVANRDYSGVGVEETITDDGFAGADAKIRIRASVGLGQVEVRR